MPDPLKPITTREAFYSAFEEERAALLRELALKELARNLALIYGVDLDLRTQIEYRDMPQTGRDKFDAVARQAVFVLDTGRVKALVAKVITAVIEEGPGRGSQDAMQLPEAIEEGIYTFLRMAGEAE